MLGKDGSKMIIESKTAAIHLPYTQYYNPTILQSKSKGKIFGVSWDMQRFNPLFIKSKFAYRDATSIRRKDDCVSHWSLRALSLKPKISCNIA